MQTKLSVIGRCLAVFLLSGELTAFAQLRIVEWNVTNYSQQVPSTRDDDFQVAIYGTFQGRCLCPDVIVAQEFIGNSAVNNFLALLNDPNFVGIPNDWAAATFVNGPDTDSAFFYRKSKVELLQTLVVSPGGSSPQHPRHVMRYTIQLVGYDAPTTILAIYSSHMKAQDTGPDDDARRLLEAQKIRENAELLPADWHFLLGADLNIQIAADPAYQELVGSQANNAGRFFDPINSAGGWNNNCAFRFVHTQDPAGGGGMDDRFDQILMEASLVDGEGFSYIGNSSIPYSTTTWNDLNHSYRAWGNDGSTCNTSIKIFNNEMVGTTIAQALFTAADGGGHLPVFVDMRVPAVVGAPTVLDFGIVPQNSLAATILNVSNLGDINLWGAAGIDDLDYTLAASAGFTAPGGAFSAIAGAAPIQHLILMDTTAPGVKSGVLTLSSDAADDPVRQITLIGEVVAAGVEGDVDGDGDVDQADLNLMLAAFGACAGDPGYNAAADFDDSGCVDQSDLNVLLASFGAP